MENDSEKKLEATPAQMAARRRRTKWPGKNVRQYYYKSSIDLEVKLSEKVRELAALGIKTNKSEIQCILVEKFLDSSPEFFREHINEYPRKKRERTS